MTPYEALYKSKPKISHLQPFGKDCYVHIPEEHRPPGSKLLLRAEKGIFFGYTNSHSIYKIQIPSRKHTMTVNARDVEFHGYRHRHPRLQPPTESTPFNLQSRNLEVHMPAPPLNRDQYINDPDIISDDALPPQSSIVHSAPAGSTRSGHPIRPLEPIDDICNVGVMVGIM